MNDVAVVVGTFDKYKAAWPVMCHGLTKYWTDCPWPVVFVTDRAAPPAFSAIKVGKPTGWDEPAYWSERMMNGLRRVKSSVILWLSEDNWITAPPDTGAIKDFAGYILDRKADHVRLYPGWDHDIPAGVALDDNRLRTFAKKSPYRCSLKPGLWWRGIFLELLQKGETAWQFEQKASKRSRKYRGRFVAVADWGYFPMVTRGDPSGDWVKSPIVKGRWTKAAKAYCDREGLKVDFSKHPVDEIIDDKLRKVDWILP